MFAMLELLGLIELAEQALAMQVDHISRLPQFSPLRREAELVADRQRRVVERLYRELTEMTLEGLVEHDGDDDLRDEAKDLLTSIRLRQSD